MTSIASAQFGTVAQVEIIPPFSNGVLVNPDLSGRSQQLRVDWAVRKGAGGSQPNGCEIRVFNMRKSSRDRAGGIVRRIIDFSDEFAFLDGRLVEGSDLGGVSEVSTANGFGALRLSVRYTSSTSASSANLFEGTATRVGSEHQRTTWVTTIEGGDGVMQSSSAIADKSWSSSVGAAEVIEYLTNRVMVTNLATPIPPQLAGYTFVGGYDATNFYATDILDQLVALPGIDASWWWDDGEVYFADIGQPLPGAPIVVSPKPGPGVYRLLSKPRPLDGGDIEIETLNLPQLRPHTAVTIEASTFAGSYFAPSVAHRGSNKGSRVSRTVARLRQIGVVPFL